MLIYKNKASEKYFIHIDDLTDNEALFVLPPDDKDGKVLIKNIEFHLFHEEPEEGEAEIFIDRQLISEKQLEKYKQYRLALAKKFANQAVAIFKDLPSYEKDRIKKEGGKRAEWLKFAEELIEQGWDED